LEVDVQQGNFKILRLLPQVLILCLVEKWIPPSRSETAENGQKTKGILGIKWCLLIQGPTKCQTSKFQGYQPRLVRIISLGAGRICPYTHFLTKNAKIDNFLFLNYGFKFDFQKY
jgi:hypothetical protein